MSARRGVYPGSFNPPTLAHLAIAEAARERAGLDRLDLTLSRVTLAKEQVTRPTVDERAGVLRLLRAERPWLGVRVTTAQLLADVAAGYDVVVMGADKWHQIHDVTFYGSAAARDDAVASLPSVLVVPRGDLGVPDDLRLDVDDPIATVSSTGARGDQPHWMLPEATAAGLWAPDEDCGRG